jgi:hypothetical protein
MTAFGKFHGNRHDAVGSTSADHLTAVVILDVLETWSWPITLRSF